MKVFVLFALVLTIIQACEDQSEYCADWKLSGWCEEYKDHLKESCARTCGFCGGSSGGGGDGSNVVAIDNRPAREPRSPDFCTDACATGACEWYKTAEHCTKFSAVMVENCARTCGWCGAATCAPPALDNGWTDFENTLVPAGAVVNVNCYEGFKSYGASTLTCNSYGEFDGTASCVKPDEDYGYASRETECQRAVKSAQTESFKDGEYVVPQESTHYVPQCDTYEGNYKQIQYDGAKGESFCVDTYRGSEIEGTRIAGKHEYIGCTRDSAKEYYARIEAEKAAANPAPVYEEPYANYQPEPAPYYEPEPEYNDYYEAPAEPAYDPWAYDTTAEDAWAEESWDDAADTSFDSDSYYDESSGDDYGYYETRYYDAGADAEAVESAVDTVYYADAGEDAVADDAVAEDAAADADAADAVPEAVGLRWKRDVDAAEPMMEDAMAMEPEAAVEELAVVEEMIEELMAEDAAEPMTK